jgi:hypothetical protein
MTARDSDENAPYQEKKSAAPGARQDMDPRAVACPFCHSTDVELLSLFGSQLSTDQWYCQNCHTPFERLRRDDE